MTSPRIDELPALSQATARELRGALRGELVLPGDAAYDEARSVWSGDETPAAEGILGESMLETPQPVVDGAEDR